MMETERNKAIDGFLGPGARRTPLAGDASFRRYERIFINGLTRILMDAPPEKESVIPFVALAHYLKGRGFSAPAILATDIDQGLLLLEDLGDDTFNRVLARNKEATERLYRAAVEVLVILHKKPPPKAIAMPDGRDYGLGVYDKEALFRELFLFLDWYLPEIAGQKVPESHGAFEKIWGPLFDQIIPENSVVTLRDYHADNLMWLPERVGIERVGLLDFQDGLFGHPAYDLVSLLQDARRPFDRDLEATMVDYYLKGAGVQDREAFLAAYQILGAQRNIKIIGIFTRLWRRDGKPVYPPMIPHVWLLLEENLKHPALKGAKAWFDEVVPRRLRDKNLV